MKNIYTKIRILLSVTLLLMALSKIQTQRQVEWIKDLSLAKSMALAQNKLILIDFDASWCVPCKKMMWELWKTEKMEPFLDTFIFLKLDIDQNPKIFKKLGERTIPNIVLIDASESVIGSKLGYLRPQSYVRYFGDIPGITMDFSYYLKRVIDHKASSAHFIGLGLMYQTMAVKTKNKTIQKTLLKLANKQFHKILELSSKIEMQKRAKLGLILNLAITGSSKKIKKALKSFKQDKTYEDHPMFKTIEAIQEKRNGNLTHYKATKKKLDNKNLIAILNLI